MSEDNDKYETFYDILRKIADNGGYECIIFPMSKKLKVVFKDEVGVYKSEINKDLVNGDLVSVAMDVYNGMRSAPSDEIYSYGLD